MKFIRLIIESVFLLAAVSLPVACGGEKNPVADQFEVKPQSLTVDAPGGQVSFSVLSSEDGRDRPVLG